MAINKVVYGQNTLIDLTSDTVSGGKMLSGTTAHDKSGSAIVGSIPSKSSQTYTPGTSNQTIPANQYLTGAQTILGDANLIASNIKKDVNIFGVTGTYSGGSAVQTYTGTFSTNNNGYASANCGFTPNIVALDNYTQVRSFEGYPVQDRAVAIFDGLSSDAWHESYFLLSGGGSQYEGVYEFITHPISNGFEVIFIYWGWNWQLQRLSASMVGPIAFTAYKF